MKKKLEKEYDFVDFKVSNNQDNQKNQIQRTNKVRKGYLDLDLDSDEEDEESKSRSPSISQKSASRRM